MVIPNDAPACMGGFCLRRERCPHYGAEGRARLVERLCVAGCDGLIVEQPIRVHRAPVDFEPALVPALLRRNWTVFAEVGA